MAPEQALNASGVDQRADIYSLGCTLFFLLCGRPVYHGKSITERVLAHQRQPIPSLRDYCLEARPWLDRVFQKMVAKDRGGWYPTMLPVADALRQPQKPTLWARLRRLFGGHSLSKSTPARRSTGCCSIAAKPACGTSP